MVFWSRWIDQKLYKRSCPRSMGSVVRSCVTAQQAKRCRQVRSQNGPNISRNSALELTSHQNRGILACFVDFKSWKQITYFKNLPTINETSRTRSHIGYLSGVMPSVRVVARIILHFPLEKAVWLWNHDVLEDHVPLRTAGLSSWS